MRKNIVTSSVAFVVLVLLTGFKIAQEDAKCCKVTSDSESSFVDGSGAPVVVELASNPAAPTSRSPSDQDSATRSHDSDQFSYRDLETGQDRASFARSNRWARVFALNKNSISNISGGMVKFTSKS